MEANENPLQLRILRQQELLKQALNRNKRRLIIRLKSKR